MLVPLADAITEGRGGSWHLDADETTWRVFAPCDGYGPAKWWLWVLMGPETVYFVIDPTGAVLARYWAFLREDRAAARDEDGGRRSLVISATFTGRRVRGERRTAWSPVLLGSRQTALCPGQGRDPVQLKY